ARSDLADVHLLCHASGDDIGCLRVAPSPVPIVGATGALGFGLALRLAREGVPIVIGSRAAERAEEAATRVREHMPGAEVEGLENAEAVTRGPLVLLCVPFRAQSENLT